MLAALGVVTVKHGVLDCFIEISKAARGVVTGMTCKDRNLAPGAVSLATHPSSVARGPVGAFLAGLLGFPT